MSDTESPRLKRWYQELPAWATAAAVILGGLVAGIQAFGQVADHGKRLDTLEGRVSAHGERLTALDTDNADSKAWRERVENKIDRLMIRGGQGADAGR